MRGAGIGIYPPDLRGGEYVLATSDASALQRSGADEILPGSNDQARIATALTRLPSSRGKVKIVGLTVTCLIDADADMITLTSGQYVELCAGVTCNVTITGVNRYLFDANGTSTAIEDIGLLGEGEYSVAGTADNQGVARIRGDVKGVYVAPTLKFTNTDPTLSDGPCIHVIGNAGWGVRDCFVGGTFEGWAYGSSDQDDGPLMFEGNVSFKTDVNVRNCSNGVNAHLTDALPTAAKHFDSSLASYTNLTNAIDNDLATTVVFTLDTNDRLLICGASAFQSIWLSIGTGNTNEGYAILETTPDGTTWNEQKTLKDATAAASGGNHASLNTDGEIVWGLPEESEWASSTINGTAGFWLSLRFVDNASTPVAVLLTAVTMEGIVLAHMPHDLLIEGRIHGISRAACQLRGVHRANTKIVGANIGTHGVNFNSDDTTVLAASNGRYFRTREFRDDSVVSHSFDTMVLTRCVDGGTLAGVYSNGEEAGWEQGTGDSDYHKTLNVNFIGTIRSMGRECVRVSGDGNVIGGLLVDAGRRQELSGTGQFRQFISIIKTDSMSTPANNVIKATIGNTDAVRSGQSAVWTEGDVTGANYVSKDVHWFNLGAAPINDSGGALVLEHREKVGILVSAPDGAAITTGDGKAYFRVPVQMNGMNLVGVRASVSTASTSGTPTIQVRNATQAADMLSTRITIDANETDSSTAAAAAVIDTANDDVATGDQIAIDNDVAGTGAKGEYVELQFERP